MRNIIGEKFGRLTVLDIDGSNIESSTYKQKYICLCDCGNYTKVRYDNLIYGHTKSCGCLIDESHTKRIEDLSGKRFGRLTVISIKQTNKKRVEWICKCDCGNTAIVTSAHLKNGHTKSCGCLFKEKRQSTNLSHGMSKSRIYALWNMMKQRCTNPVVYNYCDYGGRGISVCDDWINFDGFYKWALANGYQEWLTIDRIDNNVGYCPENCRWVSAKIQANNRRNNKIIEYNGEKHTLSEWSDIVDIKSHTIGERLRKGWTVEKALTTPVKSHEPTS